MPPPERVVRTRQEAGEEAALLRADLVVLCPAQQLALASLVDLAVGGHGLDEPEPAPGAVEQQRIGQQLGGLDRQPEFTQELVVRDVDLALAL
jgi:hypothetical protein